ncbi:MAG: hypothetical protein QOD77_1625 [Thermoplasmata archaeon]|jgi:hypothetical protein|nr:hypothetical protein [Thermoplasmata archaeon]
MRTALLLGAASLLAFAVLAPAASATCTVPPGPPIGVGCSLLPIPAGDVTDVLEHVIGWASCNAIVTVQNADRVATYYGTWAISCI